MKGKRERKKEKEGKWELNAVREGPWGVASIIHDPTIGLPGSTR